MVKNKHKSSRWNEIAIFVKIKTILEAKTEREEVYTDKSIRKSTNKTVFVIAKPEVRLIEV